MADELDADAKAKIVDAGRRVLARRSLLDFCAYTDDDYDPTLAHAQIICEYLDALAKREIENLAIFMPPQHGKSYHFSQRFPAYMLGLSGGKALVATTSYTIDVARKNSRASRDLLIDRERYPFDVAINHGGADEWYTEQGGGVKAAGVGGSLTGFGANVICVDDPIKGKAEAESPLIRDKTWDWYTTVVSTRRRANTQKLLAQTRWHEDDLAGRVLNSKAAKNWVVLNLRSFAEEDDPLHRPIGAVLWPGGPVPLSVADGEISARDFAALYQQRPTPDAGTIFQRAWFQNRYTALPALRRGVIFLDGAWKEGIGNDRSALALWVTNGVKYYLADAWAGRLSYPDLRTKCMDFWNKHRSIAPNMVFAVEDAASGIPIVQEFSRATNIPVIPVRVDRNKRVRAEAITPEFESGKVWLPEDAPWLDEWIEEHIGFDALKHDDWVDTTSGALTRLKRTAGNSTAFFFGKNA